MIRISQIDPKVSEKRETIRTVIRGELLTTIQSILTTLNINNQTLITIRRVTTMDDKLRHIEYKDWIDNMLDEDDNQDTDYIEYEDQSFGDLDLDYTHSQ